MAFIPGDDIPQLGDVFLSGEEALPVWRGATFDDSSRTTVVASGPAGVKAYEMGDMWASFGRDCEICSCKDSSCYRCCNAGAIHISVDDCIESELNFTKSADNWGDFDSICVSSDNDSSSRCNSPICLDDESFPFRPLFKTRVNTGFVKTADAIESVTSFVATLPYTCGVVVVEDNPAQGKWILTERGNSSMSYLYPTNEHGNADQRLVLMLRLFRVRADGPLTRTPRAAHASNVASTPSPSSFQAVAMAPGGAGASRKDGDGNIIIELQRRSGYGPCFRQVFAALLAHYHDVTNKSEGCGGGTGDGGRDDDSLKAISHDFVVPISSPPACPMPIVSAF